MKKLFLFLFVVFLFNTALYSQVTWNSQSSGTYENLNGIFLVNSYIGYAVGNNGVVLKTTNGGQYWDIKSFPASTSNLSVYFQNAMTGFVGNQDANVYKTVDGGNSWEVNGSASTYAITSISMPSVSAGYCGDHYSNLQKSTDNGQTWLTLTTTPGYDAKIFFMNENRGWLVDNYGYVYSTANAGLNWSNVRISTDTISSVYFITSSIGYVAGDSGRVFKTVNGGTNWTLLNTGTTVKLNSIYVQNLNEIYACGNAGTILYSGNGGTSWTVETHGTNNLKDMNFIPATVFGNTVGDLGTVYRTNTAGLGCIGIGTVSCDYPFTTYWMGGRTQMLFTAAEIAAAGGIANSLITQVGFNVTVNSTQLMEGFNINIQNTSLTSLTSWVTSGWTNIYTGTYSVPGTGWQYINCPTSTFHWNGTSNILLEVCYTNSSYTTFSTVNATTLPGMIYGYYNDNITGCTTAATNVINDRPNVCFTMGQPLGVNNHNNGIPTKYELGQNYPNPFNPTTKIKYGLPKQSFVTLKIFDMLGREIKTLVNEQLQAGEYINEFNASDLPSGTYFYRLQTNNFTETKKMVLIK